MCSSINAPMAAPVSPSNNRCNRPLALLLAASFILPAAAAAQRPADVDAVNHLIDQYGATEDAMDIPAQARLMSTDRVLISQSGRRTDQTTNMRIQQAANEAFKKQVPGVQMFTEDRDRLIRFFANGAVAVASFYRYTNIILPPHTPPDVAKQAEAGPPEVLTLVLEKRDGEWKIVHTHISNLYNPS
jgi:ketosteroid isomerase-like protein